MPSILFVCTANICRSPMAEALFKRELARQASEAGEGEWIVRSAGTWAQDVLPAASGASAAMAARKLDLSGHRSQMLTEALLREADVVFVMTSGHRESILAEFPFTAGKVFLISQLSGVAFDIADPYGGPSSGYESCADELGRLIEAGFGRIVELAARDHNSS